VATTVTTGTGRPGSEDVRPGGDRPARNRRRLRGRFNLPAAFVSFLWLAIVVIPLYWIVVTSLKLQSDYFITNPFTLPDSPTLENYRFVWAEGFARYFLNSVVVSVGAVLPAVVFSFMAAYAIIRAGHTKFLRYVNLLFLAGLAIPLQAVVIPIYLIIIRLQMYDSLLGIILPSLAFAIPLSVLVLANFIRDIPKELFESMRLDGASEWRTLWNLAAPLTRPALVTVSIYQLLTVWNGFILPLILTQSAEQRTLPLALVSFQGQYGVNVPAIMASVVLTTLPILAIYVIGRRQLLSGLTAGFGK
jgi:raffinose/stachyose/melibiose transport system permease protein